MVVLLLQFNRFFFSLSWFPGHIAGCTATTACSFGVNSINYRKGRRGQHCSMWCMDRMCAVASNRKCTCFGYLSLCKWAEAHTISCPGIHLSRHWQLRFVRAKCMLQRQGPNQLATTYNCCFDTIDERHWWTFVRFHAGESAPGRFGNAVLIERYSERYGSIVAY
jgi:hypothetical protein